MNPPLFPLEIISKIFLYVPFLILKDWLDDLLASTLKSAISTVLYEKITVGDEELVGFYRVSLKELRDLGRRKIKGGVGELYINFSGSTSKDFELAPFLTFCKENATFVSEIPKITFKGTANEYKKCAKILPIDNIVELRLSAGKSFAMTLVPPNVEIVQLDFEDLKALKLENWPNSLRSLQIDCTLRSFNIELPANLNSLTCGESEDLWSTFPSTLTKLDLSQNSLLPLDDLTFPESLAELKLSACNLEDLGALKLPASLKLLDLAYNMISSITLITFPECLEVLDLLYCSITSLQGIQLPVLLQELYLANNSLTTLDNVQFPNLKILNISNYLEFNKKLIKSLEKVQFPPSLSTLYAEGQPIADWNSTKFPASLKVLKLLVPKEVKTIHFPCLLENLKVQFSSLSVKYSALEFPPGLILLEIVNGYSSVFDWGLPLLQSLSVINFTGHIEIPQSVENLTLEGKKKSFDMVGLPLSLSKLRVSYPPMSYPESLVELEILNFQHSKVPFPRGLLDLSLEPGEFGDEINGRGLELPYKLQCLQGPFDPTPQLPHKLRFFTRVEQLEDFDASKYF